MKNETGRAPKSTTKKRGGKSSMIEVWLSMKDQFGVRCWVVDENEHSEDYQVDALSLRGAEREITSYFIGEGYEPVERWNDESVNENTGDAYEASRRFRLKELQALVQPAKGKKR